MRTLSRTANANIDCVFVENALVFVVPKTGWARAPLANPPDINEIEGGWYGSNLLHFVIKHFGPLSLSSNSQAIAIKKRILLCHWTFLGVMFLSTHETTS